MTWRWHVLANLLTSPRMGAEIGVKEGRFIQHMLTKFPDLVMYAVDPWEHQPESNETYEEWDFNGIYNEYSERVKPYHDRVVEMAMYSDEAAELIPDRSLDFVFIDAQHDYLSVKRDIECWLPKVKPGGLMSGHDYCHKFPGVVNAVDERFNATPSANDVWYIWV